LNKGFCPLPVRLQGSFSEPDAGQGAGLEE